MFRYEMKKILFYRRSLWLILGLVCLELLSTLLFTKPYDAQLERNRQVYESYLSTVEGPLTQENRDYLEAEMERLDENHQALENLKQSFYAGAISEGEYRQQYDKMMEQEELYAGFSKLYTQYIFVREQDNRAFLYTGGWEVLLTEQTPDYLLLLLLVVVLSPIFCEEYASQMDKLLLTQKRSARQQVWIKLGAALLLTALVAAVLEIFRLGYCAVRFGLPHGDYSLQSLYSFGTTAKEMTLWQAFALQFALKELGYLYGAILVIALSVLLRKLALTLMAGVALLPLPLLTTQSASFLRVPGPWALTAGSIYLNPSWTYMEPATGEVVVARAEVLWPELMGLVGISLGIMVLLLVFIRGKNTNFHIKKTPWKKAALAFCAGMLLLTGCSGEKSQVVYNNFTANWYENENVVVLGNIGEPLLLEKATDTAYPFPLNALNGESLTASRYLYGETGSLYYIRQSRIVPEAGSQSYGILEELVRLDLDTMSEQVIYQWNEEEKWFFGLLEKEQEQKVFVLSFFLHGGCLYFDGQDGLYRLNLLTGTREMYLEDISQDFAYDGKYLYYTDAYSRLVMHDLDTGKETVSEEVIAQRFLLTEKGIYFLNIRDNSTLYYWNQEENAVEKLGDIPAYSIYWDREFLWIESSEDSCLYRMNQDGSDSTQVSYTGVICCLSGGDKLYTHDFETGTLYRIDKHTLEIEPVSTDSTG